MNHLMERTLLKISIDGRITLDQILIKKTSEDVAQDRV
jgi:hypothetical protein